MAPNKPTAPGLNFVYPKAERGIKRSQLFFIVSKSRSVRLISIARDFGS